MLADRNFGLPADGMIFQIGDLRERVEIFWQDREVFLDAQRTRGLRLPGLCVGHPVTLTSCEDILTRAELTLSYPATASPEARPRWTNLSSCRPACRSSSAPSSRGVGMISERMSSRASRRR